jgi:hypothetical protein
VTAGAFKNCAVALNMLIVRYFDWYWAVGVVGVSTNCMVQDEHLNDHGGRAPPVSCYYLRRCVREAEAQPGILSSAGNAAKVDDSPSVLPGKPHHVAGLEVTMHQAQLVQVSQTKRQLMHHLHAH